MPCSIVQLVSVNLIVKNIGLRDAIAGKSVCSLSLASPNNTEITSKLDDTIAEVNSLTTGMTEMKEMLTKQATAK